MKKAIVSTGRFLFTAALCLILPLGGCTDIEDHPEGMHDTCQYPLLELQDTTIVDVYDGSRLAWILQTRYMRQAAKSRVIFCRPVKMAIYDSLEKETAWVEADSGSADESITFISVWGNVYAKTQDGAAVEADSLIWKKHSNTISTDGWVKVISREGDTLNGTGFISDDKLENWKILSHVRGVIQKVEQRIMPPPQEAEQIGEDSLESP